MKAWVSLTLLLSAVALADVSKYYPDPYWKEPSLVEYYRMYYEEYKSAQGPRSALLAPPSNLASGDGQLIVAQKLAMSRVDIIQNQIKDIAQTQVDGMSTVRSATKTFNDLNSKVSKVTNQAVNVKSSLCDIKFNTTYDYNRSTLTAQSVCDAYNAKIIYNTATDAYEASVFKQLQPTVKVGVKSASVTTGCLAFLEGSW